MKAFTESEHCRGREKCHLCRDPGERGQQFREALRQLYEMPGEGLFACPFGLTVEGLPVRPPPVFAVPHERWPRPILLIARFKREGECGAGDTLARLLGKVGGEAWKEWYKRLTGEECRCGDRRARLNVRYPYQLGGP